MIKAIKLPLLDTIKKYKSHWLRADIIAGLTIAGLAVPQAIAYAEVAGVQLTAGLYAAIAAMIVYAFFSTTRYVITGPDAAMAALAGAAVLPLTNGDSHRATLMIAMLAIMVGLISVTGVMMKISYMAEFMSRPILLGYMAGLALAIITSQAPKLIGLDSPIGNNFAESLTSFGNLNGKVHLTTAVFSGLLLLIAFTIRLYSKFIPLGIFLLIGSISASIVFDFQALGIATVGSIPSSLPLPNLPLFVASDIQNLLVPALVITLVAYANTATLAGSYARKSNTPVIKDQELNGLGAANIASGIFGGMPVSASAARTAISASSGAKTQVSQLVGAVAIIFVIVLFSRAFEYLPQAALAGIVIIAVLPLFDIKELRSIWHAWRSEALLALATAVGVLVLGILQGLLLAILLAILNWVRKSAFPYDAVLGIAADGAVRDVSRPPKTKTIPGLIIYRLDAPLFFGNANYFSERIHNLIAQSEQPVRWFLWDAETITTIDSTGGQVLVNTIRDLKKQGITFAISRMKGPVRATFRHSHKLTAILRNTPHFTSLGDAIEAYYKENPDNKID